VPVAALLQVAATPPRATNINVLLLLLLLMLLRRRRRLLRLLRVLVLMRRRAWHSGRGGGSGTLRGGVLLEVLQHQWHGRPVAALAPHLPESRVHNAR
jgi:hypothetical protein